jgi:hypothetical protein
MYNIRLTRQSFVRARDQTCTNRPGRTSRLSNYLSRNDYALARGQKEKGIDDGLALMFTLIEGLGLRQITARVLHELALGVRAAEAVGLALKRRIDRSIRLHVLVIGETPGTHVAQLAVYAISRTGKADDKDASHQIFFYFGRSSVSVGRPSLELI